MKKGLVHPDLFIQLFESITRDPINLVKVWLQQEPLSRKRIRDVLHQLLYAPIKFVVWNEGISLFGDKTLLIPFKRMSPFLCACFETILRRYSESLFKVRKDLNFGFFEYSQFCYNDAQLLTQNTRRQIARNVCIQLQTIPSTIMAVQDVLQTDQGSRDRFLSAIHQGLQGACDLKEVPAWIYVPQEVIW